MNNLFKNKRISKTPFRKEVLAIFCKYNNAIPLSVIEKELKDYNRITLYRTIKLFLEKGIIHEISINGEIPNYAICMDDCDTIGHQHQHIHFNCRSCGLIFCKELDKLPTIKLPNYKIDQMEIQVTGLCESCNV